MLAPQSFLIDYDRTGYSLLSGAQADLIIYETGETHRTRPSPVHLSPSELAALNALGKTVIGYVNVAVTDHERSYWQGNYVDYTSPLEKDVGPVTASAPDWLKNNRGTVDFDGIPGADAYLVDYTDGQWQSQTIRYAEIIVEAGYDGVFLDDVGQYFQAGWYGGAYDPAWAQEMIRFVIDISDAVRAINPNAYVAVNSGINIGFDSFIDLNGSLWADYLGAIDAVLLENQFANEGPGGPQDALSDAVARFQAQQILSVEAYAATFDIGEWLQFCGDNDVFPYLPASDDYDQYTDAPMLGSAARDTLRLTKAGIAGGLEGGDRLIGSADGDRMWGHAGGDRLFGRGGADELDGGRNNDRLMGGGAADTLRGGNGADLIDGGGGNDTSTGGGGRDTFVFRSGCGTDHITDFTSGSDTLRILTGATSFDDLDIAGTAQGLRLEFDGVRLFLDGLTPGALMAGDVVFT